VVAVQGRGRPGRSASRKGLFTRIESAQSDDFEADPKQMIEDA